MNDSNFWKRFNDRSSFFDFVLLGVIIIISSLFLFYVSLLRYENFYTTNWDFGIAEQLLWTGSHGYLLFETGDYSTSFAHSFLQIHSVYIALILSPIYAHFPGPSFLFIFQSLAVSLSIIPLYFIVSTNFRERKLIFLIILIYLTSFGLLSAFFYDFHWELLIPIEYFSLFYLVSQKKYLLSIIPFIIGISTLEVFPLIAAGIFLYFAYSYNGSSFLNPIHMHKDRDSLFLFVFFLASFLSYAFYRFLQFYILPQILKIEPTVSISISSTGFIPSGFNLYSFVTSIFYWNVIYASLGYIPVLSRKHFILMLPLFIGFIFIDPHFASGFGNQYSAISLPILIIGFSLGLSKLQFNKDRRSIIIVLLIYFVALISVLLIFNSSVYLLNPTLPLGVVGFLILAIIAPFLLIYFFIHGRGYLNNTNRIINKIDSIDWKKFLTLFFIFVIAFNLLLGPFNINNFDKSAYPGYWIAYTPNPEYKYALILSEKISSSATVLASDNLFPLVANNPNAYSLLWFPFSKKQMPNLPFNSTNLPEYIFVDSSQNFLPQNLSNILTSSSAYGLLGYVLYSGYPGNIYLYEKGYNGSVLIYT